MFKKGLTLLGPGTRAKWAGLVVLAIFVSFLEAMTALLVFVLLAVVVSPDSEIVVPLLGDLNERFPSLTETRSLITACAIIGGFFLFRAAVYFVQSYLQNHLAFKTAALLSTRLLHGYLAMPYAAFIRRNSAELLRNAHESSLSLASWVLLPGIVLAAESCVIVALCVVLFLTSPLVAAGAFAFLGILVFVLLKIVQPRLHALGLSVQQHTEQSLKSLQQTLQGLRDIRLMGKEEYFEDEFSQTREQLARAFASRGLLIDAPRISLETSVLLIVIMFVLVQVARTDQLGDGLTALGMFGYAALRVLPSVNRIVNNLQALRFAVPLVNLLHQDVIDSERIDVDSATELEVPLIFESIELKNVDFRYPETQRDALSDVSLKIRRGESIGIVGETGSGKSTLLDLVLGLFDPSAGAIYINEDLLGNRHRVWQQTLAVVPQTVFLLDDTIKRNIALGLPDDAIDFEQLLESVGVAQLDEFIASIPDGLETIVGERGVRLSGGQRQRLAIARAIYRQPSILVLDEGTSALDNRTEAKLIEDLSHIRDDLTIISVAHRVSSIQNYDRILVLSDGRLVAEGTFSTLLAENEMFRALARLRTSGDET